MGRWECAIRGECPTADSIEELLLHQARDHERVECKVCGTVVPDGYFAIAHAFDDHTRAEYVRAYRASAEEVRRRERIKSHVETRVDLGRVVDRLILPATTT